MEENDSILRFSNKKTNEDDFVAQNLLRAYRIDDTPEEIIVFPHKETLTSDVGQNSIEHSRLLLAGSIFG
ncbi:hypothetical protein PRUPE_7G072100 [Prunus persica]|uniref:Uncharacterized protein n=1 Tax=Prunus persica TaxID=3760 RepID=A0A251N804_PRUPE|nr:hypothetical protein PRUPE_7G072100 [Prunus persica]